MGQSVYVEIFVGSRLAHVSQQANFCVTQVIWLAKALMEIICSVQITREYTYIYAECASYIYLSLQNVELTTSVFLVFI